MKSTQQTLTVMGYEWKAHDSILYGDRRLVINCWAFDRDTKPVLIRIKDYYCQLYVGVPLFWNNTHVTWTQSALNDLANVIVNTVQCSGIHVDSYVPVMKKVACYYNGNSLFPMIKFTFPKELDATNFKRMMKKVVFRDVLTHLIYYEAEVPLIRKFLTKYKLKFSQWFTISVEEVMTGKISRGREYIGNRTSICPIDPELTLSWHTKPTILSFDCETYSHNHKAFSNQNDIRDRNYMTVMLVWKVGNSFENAEEETDQIAKFGIVWGECENKRSVDRLYTTNSEAEYCETIFRLFVAIDADIIIGYNILGFDFEYIYTRSITYAHMNIPQLGRLIDIPADVDDIYVDKSWSSSASKFVSVKYFSMEGRIVFDPLGYLKKEQAGKPSYRLDDVSKEYLGTGKVPITIKETFSIYKRYLEGEDVKEEMEKILYYCAIDCLRPLQIFDKLSLWHIICEMSMICGLNHEDIYIRGTGKRTESLLYDGFKKRGYVMNSSEQTLSRNKGGFVFEVIPGLHDCVTIYDFQSLYPSVIQAENLCCSTLIHKDHVHKFNPEDYTQITIMNGGINIVLTFIKATVMKGVLPEVLKELLAERAKVRSMLRFEKDKVTLAILNGRQLALKVCANAAYGYMGSAYSAYPCYEVAGATCAIGQKLIKNVSTEISEMFKGIVVAGDTDSYMIKLPGSMEIDKDSVFEKGNSILDVMNGVQDKEGKVLKKGMFPPPIFMNLEFFMKILVIKKKNYIFAKYQADKNKPGYGDLLRKQDGTLDLSMKGVPPVKKENCLWIRRHYEQQCQLVFSGKTFHDSLNLFIEDIQKLVSGNIPITDLVMITGMGSNYKAKGHHLAIFSERLVDKGIPVERGDSLEYLIIYKKDEKKKGPKMYLIEEYYADLLENKEPEIDRFSYISVFMKKISTFIQRVFDPTKDITWTSGRKTYNLERLSEYTYEQIALGLPLEDIKHNIEDFYAFKEFVPSEVQHFR